MKWHFILLDNHGQPRPCTWDYITTIKGLWRPYCLGGSTVPLGTLRFPLCTAENQAFFQVVRVPPAPRRAYLGLLRIMIWGIWSTVGRKAHRIHPHPTKTETTGNWRRATNRMQEEHLYKFGNQIVQWHAEQHWTKITEEPTRRPDVEYERFAPPIPVFSFISQEWDTHGSENNRQVVNSALTVPPYLIEKIYL